MQCANVTCRREFTPANGTQKFCSPHCRYEDNVRKRERLPLALQRVLLLVHVRLTLGDAMLICDQVGMTWLSLYLARRGVSWSEGHWRMKIIKGDS